MAKLVKISPKKSIVSQIAAQAVTVPPFDDLQVREAVHNFLDGIAQGQSLEHRWPTLRASSFPYCPIIMALTEPWKANTYRSDYYFDTGTAIHGLIQRWASRADYAPRLWGMWKCSECGTLADSEPSFKPKIEYCPTCEHNPQALNTEWLYEEVTLQWRDLSGHVDTILKVGPNAWVVVDYKTTEFRYQGALADRKRFPYGANVTQIGIYCALLREIFELPIVGWCLVYVHRGRPIRGANSYHLSTGAWTEERHARMMRRLKWANKHNVTAQQIIADRQEGRPLDRVALASIVEARPCRTVAQYRSWMEPKFHYEEAQFEGKGACSHVETCTGGCSDKKLTQYFAEILES